MIEYFQLTILEKQEVIDKAEKYRTEHSSHVRGLISYANYSYAPSGSDVFRPELWKPAHWKWFKETEGI